MRLILISVFAFLIMSHGAMAAGKDDVSKDMPEENGAEEEALAKPVKKKAEKKAKAEEKKGNVKVEKRADKKDVPGAYDCPESINVSDQKLKTPVKGFTVYNADVTYWLETVSVYSGDKVLSKVDPARSTEATSWWPLTDNGKTHYWLGCGYAKTNVILKKPLGEGVRNCHSSPKKNPANPNGPSVMHGFVCE